MSEKIRRLKPAAQNAEQGAEAPTTPAKSNRAAGAAKGKATKAAKEAPAPAKGKAAKGKATKAPGLSKEEKAAARKELAAKAGDTGKVKKARAPSEGGRGSSRPYKVLQKANPFREGSHRAERWDAILSSKNIAEAREKNPRCGKAFMDKLEARGLIEYTD